MKKRFNEEQIIGFLGEAEAGLPIKDLYRATAVEHDNVTSDSKPGCY